jgi:protein gp37
MTKSKIEWTDRVWNPVTGCTKVSQGCKHCYAETMAERFWATQYPPVKTGKIIDDYHPDTGPASGEEERPRKFTDVLVHPERLDQPSRWRKPARVFVNSMSDLFHEDVPSAFIQNVFEIMREAKQHTFQILTKRPERMLKEVRVISVYGTIRYPIPNVWLGVSVENQATADERIPLLLQTPAAVRFVSCEPLLEEVDLLSSIFRPGIWELAGGTLHSAIQLRGLDWVIVGGESGPNARPMHPDWARSLRDQCQASGVPFFFKQWGEWSEVRTTKQEIVERKSKEVRSRADGSLFFRVGKRSAGRLLDGREWNEYPGEG